MKLPVSFFLVLSSLFIHHFAVALKFTIKVDKDCNISLFKEQEWLNNTKQFYSYTVAKNDRIIFEFEKKTTKRVLFNIKDAFEIQPSFNFNDSAFNYLSTISTDEDLNLTMKNKTIKLEAFVFFIGIEGESSKYLKIKFLLSQEQQSTQNISPQGDPFQGHGTKEIDQEEVYIYNPGSIVYDALKLSKSSEIYADDFRKIIQFYYPDKEITNTDDAIKALETNPFLNTLFIVGYKPNQRGKTVAESGGKILSSLSMSSIGGLDVTNIADGLAIFLVKRTKQELSIAFFEKFKKILEDNKYRDLKTVFPQTHDLLCNMGSEIYDYERYIQNLREAFKTDINNLIVNLPGIIDNHENFFDKHPEVKASLQSGFYLTGSLMSQVHPGDILANYPMEYLDKVNKNVKAAVQVMQLVSVSLRDTSSSDSAYWVGIKYLRQVINDKRAFRIYLGLVYQTMLNNHDIVFNDGNKLSECMNDLAQNYESMYQDVDAYRQFIAGFSLKVNELDKMIRTYTKPANDSIAVEFYAKYFKSFTGLLEYGSKVMDLPKIKDMTDGLKLKKELPFYFDLSNSLVDITCEVNRRNYSSAINHLVHVYDKVFSKSDTSDENADNSLSSSNQKMVINSVVKYGGVAAAIATAKSSQEVAQTIETAALPTGSSRVKRETAFNVSLNAYCGLFSGYERIKGIDPPWSWTYQKFNSFGVTAPIGISISRGHSIFFIGTKGWDGNEKKCGFRGWSSSVFLSVIDIGALASFRFKSPESVSTVPEIHLEDIISPGIFFSLGIPKTPLSLNLGWQMGPLLRSVTDSLNTYSQNYTRISVSLCVDIPIFNLYSLTKNPPKEKKPPKEKRKKQSD